MPCDGDDDDAQNQMKKTNKSNPSPTLEGI